MLWRNLLGCAIVAAALTIGYFLGHHAEPSSSQLSPVDPARTAALSASPPVEKPSAPARATTRHSQPLLPPPRTPLLSDFAELKARADSGDGDAASRLFHDLETCRRVRYLQEVSGQLLNLALDEPIADKSPEWLTAQDSWLARTQKTMDFVRDNAAMCEGFHSEHVEAIVPSMLVAAKSGDLTALDCYLGMELTNIPGNVLEHPEWLSQYKQNASALIQLGITNGDWRVVKLMEFAYSAGAAGTTLLDYVVGRHPDAEQEYRYQKLERLGASGDYGAQLDSNEFIGSSLNKGQIAAADKWAENLYSRYFNGTSSNDLRNWVSACPDAAFF